VPIPLPNLDDLAYADLVGQARTRIPGVLPQWTDHNPADPGIVLVELLAWLTEMLLYQVDQVPPANVAAFLGLLNGPEWTIPDGQTLDQAVAATVLGLRERYRAVTPADAEWLVLHAFSPPDGVGAVRRVRAVPRRDLAAADPAGRAAEAPAHLSVVVLADGPDPAALRQAVWDFLDGRVTLTTRHHVVAPDEVPVTVTASLALRPDARPEDVLARGRDALAGFLDPATWPFGRTVHPSEVYAVLSGVDGVDYLEAVALSTPDGAAEAGVVLDSHQLARLDAAALAAYDVYGKRYGA
jgi:Baseplate J-like protein